MSWGITNKWKRFDSEWTKSSVPSIAKHWEISCKVEKNRGPNEEMIYRRPIRCVQCNLNVDNQNWNGDIYDVSKKWWHTQTRCNNKSKSLLTNSLSSIKIRFWGANSFKKYSKRDEEKNHWSYNAAKHAELKKMIRLVSADWLILPVEKNSQVEELVLLAESI